MLLFCPDGGDYRLCLPERPSRAVSSCGSVCHSISAAQSESPFLFQERNDILPEHNKGITLIPQILTNRAEDFIWMAGELEALGYDEVNLNLGCPPEPSFPNTKEPVSWRKRKNWMRSSTRYVRESESASP